MKKATDTRLTDAVLKSGGRLTKQREEIFNLLASSPVPVSIQTLIQKVKANEVSVYRTIRFLKDGGLIEEIGYPDGTKRYALGGHHHHIICSSCGHTEHIPCSIRTAAPSISHPQFASIEHHEVTYHGTCGQCA
jgi:Fe2+ or Zn2+ uptake regulation protein